MLCTSVIWLAVLLLLGTFGPRQREKVLLDQYGILAPFTHCCENQLKSCSISASIRCVHWHLLVCKEAPAGGIINNCHEPEAPNNKRTASQINQPITQSYH